VLTFELQSVWLAPCLMCAKMSHHCRSFLGDALAKRIVVAALVALLSAVGAGAQSGAGNGAGAGATAGAANKSSDIAQGPERGGRELEFFSGGGPSTPGGVRGIGVWNAGFRYGWFITDLHLPGFLRGRLESAVDVTPFFWVFQPGGTAYGVGIVPAVLKWDFQQRGRVVPYVDFDGNILLTSRQTPPHISNLNFTPSAALGAHYLLHKYAVTAEIRFLHISDAGLTDPNPGINTVEVRMGFGLFKPPKRK